MMPPPESTSVLSRRQFVCGAAAAAAAVAFLRPAFGAAAPATAESAGPARPGASGIARSARAFPFCALEKHFFEQYTPEQTARTFGEMGMDIELTVRPDGHIKPANAAEKLPAMAAAFARHQRRILIVASSFVRPDEPHIESTLRAAKKLGITQYRHRGFRYRSGVPLKLQPIPFDERAGIVGLFRDDAGVLRQWLRIA